MDTQTVTDAAYHPTHATAITSLGNNNCIGPQRAGNKRTLSAFVH